MRPDWRIDDYANRSLRDSADQDYVAARTCHRLEFDQQFLWLAHQAIEKYLKAILLYSRVNTAKLGHELIPALDKVLEVPDIPIEFDADVRKFVEFVDSLGQSRYFEFPVYVQPDSLYQLDRTVWFIRLYCYQMRRVVPRLDGPDLDLLESEIQKVNWWRSEGKPHKYEIRGGYLEKVLKDPSSEARAALIWNNPFYGARAKHVLRNYSMRLSGANPAHFLEPAVFAELSQLVRFSRPVRDYFASLENGETEG